MANDFLKTVPQYLLPKRGLTAFAGCMAEVRNPKIKNLLIEQFIKKYKVNMSEALIEDPKAYSCFNDFFIRRLKPESRPLACADIISPVDGYVSEIGPIIEGQLIQAKGKNYTVNELLGTTKNTNPRFDQGQFATLYLSPKDYHRVHMPMTGTLTSMNYIPGALFSVQPTTARVIPKLFARNERLVVHFETEVGPMIMVFVGATVVGAIGTTWHGDIKRIKNSIAFDYTKDQAPQLFKQGDEIGYFKLGSTVVLLFAKGASMQWNASLSAGKPIQFGQELGALI